MRALLFLGGITIGWPFKALILSIITATVGYLVFSVWSGWQEVVDAFMKIGVWGACIALLLSFVNYGLRFVRWQMYLKHLEHPVQRLPSLRIYLSGLALTTTPGKAGEAFRCVLLKQHGVPYPVTFALFLSECSGLVKLDTNLKVRSVTHSAAEGHVGTIYQRTFSRHIARQVGKKLIGLCRV